MNNIRIVLIIAVVTVCGCRVHNVKAPLSETIELEASFSKDKGTSSIPDEWWQVYNDLTLDGLVHESLTKNTRLSQAWARLSQAGALADQANASKMPSVTADVGASRSRASSPFGENREGNQYSAGVSVGYEVDLWGRVSSLSDAALQDWILMHWRCLSFHR